jgi:hypothetical protein
VYDIVLQLVYDIVLQLVYDIVLQLVYDKNFSFIICKSPKEKIKEKIKEKYKEILATSIASGSIIITLFIYGLLLFWVILMSKRKNEKFKKAILDNQKEYEELRKKAHQELEILEEFFGRRQIDKINIYSSIKRHLEASQKAISYTGLRGVFLGIFTGFLVYIFQTGVLAPLLKMKFSIDNYFLEALSVIIITGILVLFFIGMYFISTGHFFLEDRKRRNQIYINEYLIEFLEERIEELKK